MASPESTLPKSIVVEPIEREARATGVRYMVLAFLAVMTFVLYLDRVCIGQAAPRIMEDLGLSNTLMGLVFAAFTLSYGLFEVPTGHLGDRYGSRGVLARIVIWWSAFTALTGAVFGFWSLLAVRFLFGAGEAGALPNAARVVRRWFPESARGTAAGVVTTAMMVGGAFAPKAAAELIQGVGWRMSFVLFGAVGVVWAAAFYWWYRDDPAEHPSVNEPERQLIRAGNHASQPDGDPPHSGIPWRLVLTSPNVWLMGSLMNCGASVFYLLISWYPTYLQHGRGVEEGRSGTLGSLVLAGGALGCIAGGWLADGLMRRTGSSRASWCGVGCAAYLIGAAALLAALGCESATASAAFTAVTCFCVQLQVPAWWSTVSRISGPHVGALFGLMNSMGIVGAVASQTLVGKAVDWRMSAGHIGRDQWDPPLYAYLAVMLAGAALWLWVNPNRSVVQREGEGR